MSEPMKFSPIATLFRLVTFRATREEMAAFDRRHLMFGLVLVWLVGMGRTWDDADAEIVRRLGIGSLLYVFCLALLLWVTFKPLAPQMTYRHVLTFICLAALPGLIYAIPVELWFDASKAREINAWFLLVVALWRVALLVFYLSRFGQLEPYPVMICTLLPLSIIMVPLAMLQTAQGVAAAMGGVRGGTPPTVMQEIIYVLANFAFFLVLPLLISYQNIIKRVSETNRPEPSAGPD